MVNICVECVDELIEGWECVDELIEGWISKIYVLNVLNELMKAEFLLIVSFVLIFMLSLKISFICIFIDGLR